VTSDLGVDNTITVTVTGSMGFAGDVTLAVAATDSSSAAISDWATTLATTTVTLAQDGTQTATLKISALGDTAALAGTVKVTASSTAPSVDASISVTFNPVFDVTFMDDGTGKAVYPINHGVNNPFQVKVGRTLAVYNGSPTKILVVHSDGIAGFPHEGSSPGTASGAAYMGSGPLTAVGDETAFDCHNDQGPTTELLDPGSTNRPYVKVVQ
jgi:hypothetical protein